ncbi:hypothetical protein SAMN02799630_01642 [Paenibacillus sp. UNCCL117]|uniref:hypothetical protein n=1 Tax=unclassified Paenibacillus TaxID=185978 RepID=UPI00087EED9D|nr:MULTISPECIES: hypothetical protein [unclassified Paenibacillus]SDC89451.1 hypothetical protein SAMN04488602_104127 [Paenibacillus sp. cl123]SFW28554.1 hypothetical protein SAMN02799630_01642 [Paenibacillus sp. UNCCL117]
MSELFRPVSEEKGIPIALIGPEPMIPIMLRAIKSFPSFAPVTGTYAALDEAVSLTEKLMPGVEVILYSGPLPYQVCRERIHYRVPALFVPLTGAGLYRSLFRIERTWGLASLSVDTLPEQPFVRTFRELGQPLPELSFYDGGRPTDTEALIAFHKQQAAARGAVALTALRSVAEVLTRDGVACEWVLPTEQDIIVTLERALLSTETRKSKEAQIVVGLINIDGFRKAAELRKSEHDVQRLKLDIHRMMLEYAESLEGHVTTLGGDEYLFVTTRGTFERHTGGYKFIPLAKSAQNSLSLSLSIGVGFGRSANEAGSHARTALRHAKEAGGNLCFIVREDESVIGPLEMSEPLEAEVSLLDAALIEKAEGAGLTQLYLSRIVAQLTRTGKTAYNVHELAAVLGVTVRSTHRLLTQWMDGGLVHVAGEERGKAKGRPKQIYRFVCLDNLLRH